MPVSIQSNPSALAAHAPVDTAPVLQIALPHPTQSIGMVATVALAAGGAAANAAAGAVASARASATGARLHARLAGLPARVGPLNARMVIGGAVGTVGSLTAAVAVGSILGGMIDAQIHPNGAVVHDPVKADLIGVAVGAAGMAVAAAGVALMKSARSAGAHVAGHAEHNPVPTPPITPCHSDTDSPV